jgi:hypothetical protein
MQYAPKAKQTVALCSHPQSVCDAAYGFSVGRGSFVWTAGKWTHVKQTVTLNTPGKQDGGFVLEVNGKQAINRTDVFYRDIPPKPTPPASTGPVEPTAQPDSKPPGGLLGPLLGGLLRRIWQEVLLPVPFDDPLMTGDVIALPHVEDGVLTTQDTPPLPMQDATSYEFAIITVTSTMTTTAPLVTEILTAKTVLATSLTHEMESSAPKEAISFTGLFFRFDWYQD